MKIACIIPSRYASTRLPGKPLRMIAGETLVHRVYERAALAKLPDIVIVATDNEKIESEVKSFGGRVMMTSPDHPTGTDRLAEVAASLPDYDIVVNVQGDEPFINPDVIDSLAKMLAERDDLDMTTAAAPLKEDEYDDPSAVKVVVNQKGEALYFSRSLIPYPRNEFSVPPLKHVGIYAYRRDFLLAYAGMKQTPLEKTESLEQLRALEMGYKIGVIRIDSEDIGIDTEEDLKKANRLFERSHQ
ncbi:3-deoxy-manno-octulosonate cytidylyltransferase [Dialister hominis]|jgi:3-deoxy-manno-octulosonate cytidylyltransferase (CMP-KDO synthetase)|uniref:3-deoxy-manno-octulosonate cytidylyltransferase n=1 Tax=Dialister TaxID=39948 RepID=UPI00265D593F|nr:3-deoxy-manno-octulosonate cytidylyltransferase [uncultured Dialister sp.]HJI43367.1 3-deoxy-manno-octulosonate cytidylyltransferase [Veillonellaceae bacterium]